MPPPLWAPRVPTSTRCFLFGHGLTFLLDETLLLADAEHVTSQGDLAQTTSQQNKPACSPAGAGRGMHMLPGRWYCEHPW